MPNRPLSVTIIGWTLLAFAVIGLTLMGYLILSGYFDGEQFVAVLIFSGIFGSGQALMAYGVLKGANWARIVFLWLTPASIIFGFMGGDVGSGTIFMAGYYVVFAYLLNRPVATEYFRKEKRKDRAAYISVVFLAVMGVLGIFSPQIIRWAVETYRIGYVRHDIASLKLPPDWKELSFAEKTRGEGRFFLQQGALAAIAWGGLTATQTQQLDIETGAMTTVSNKQAFIFQPDYLRDDGAIFPCGLTRYQLSFPATLKDPLRQILSSQLQFSRGAAFKHHYFWQSDFRLVEFDADIRGYRFVVWNWWQKQEPRKIYGMILGMPTKDSYGRNACGGADIVKSLELKRADGRVWKATKLNTKDNPAMTPVSGISIELDPGRLRMFGIDPAGFFAWLKKHADDEKGRSIKKLRNASYTLASGAKITLADVARVRRIGKGIPDKNSRWDFFLVQINCDRSPNKNDIEFTKSALTSGLSTRLNCRN